MTRRSNPCRARQLRQAAKSAARPRYRPCSLGRARALLTIARNLQWNNRPLDDTLVAQLVDALADQVERLTRQLHRRRLTRWHRTAQAAGWYRRPRRAVASEEVLWIQ